MSQIFAETEAARVRIGQKVADFWIFWIFGSGNKWLTEAAEMEPQG
jgi:hypothetical protein